MAFPQKKEEFIIYAPVLALVALTIFGLGIYFVPWLFEDELVQLLSSVAVYTAKTIIFWGPFILLIAAWKLWVNYVRAAYFATVSPIVLEIKVPQEVLKTPEAMELVLMAMHQGGGETTFLDRYWKGQVRGIFSLELVSIEGKVHFYIHTWKKFKGLIETNLYSVYPGVEVYEVPDYTKSTYFDPKENDMYVVDMKLTAPDPYPIKTYIDYDLNNRNVEEVSKTDPITSIIEYLGSVGKGQQVWMQIIFRLHKDDQHKPGSWFGTYDAWKETAKKEIEKIRKETLPPGTKPGEVKFPSPTKGQTERIAALERSVSKLAFDVGIRVIYWAKLESFNGTMIGGLRGILRSYSAPHLNSFKPANWLNDFDYPWQDYKKMRQNALKREGLDAYKRRSYFYQPHIGKTPIVLNTEEMASIFHLPGQVAQTPTFVRIPSKKSEAPSNLPI